MSNTLGKIVGAVSPVIGGILNAALPGSGLIVSALGSLFGVNSSDPSDIASKINADPDASLKLRQFEILHANDLAAIEAADRASARDREKSVVSSTGKKDWTVSVLATVFVAGFFAYAFMFFFVSVEPEEHDIVMFLAGQIASLAMMVAAYYFGGIFRQPRATPEVILPPPEQTR